MFNFKKYFNGKLFTGRWENWLGAALIVVGLFVLYHAISALVPVLFSFVLCYVGYRFITEEKFELSDVVRDANNVWNWAKKTFSELWIKSGKKKV